MGVANAPGLGFLALGDPFKKERISSVEISPICLSVNSAKAAW